MAGVKGSYLGAFRCSVMFARLTWLQPLSAFFRYPLHSLTGSRGYFGNRGSRADNSHLQNTAPRSDSTIRAFMQSAHKPTLARGSSICFSMSDDQPALWLTMITSPSVFSTTLRKTRPQYSIRPP